MSASTIIEVSNLPSKFLPYPKDSKVSYRAMTFGEVRTFSQSKFSEKGRIDFMLDGITTSFDPWMLTIPDYTYLVIARKLSSLGTDTYNVPVSCYKCDARFDFVFNLKDLKFHELDAQDLPVCVEIGGKELHFKPLNIKDWIELKDKNKLTDVNILAKEVINLPFDEAYNAIYGCSGEDIDVLREVEDNLGHSLEVIEKPCKYCKSMNYIDVREEELIIYPFRESDKSIASKLRFGASPKN